MNEYYKEYRDYYIKPHTQNPKCYVIVTVGKGGKVPDILSGMYTSTTLAQEAIDKYLEMREEKEELNAKTSSKSRGK